jgi:hypothetical protein
MMSCRHYAPWIEKDVLPRQPEGHRIAPRRGETGVPDPEPQASINLLAYAAVAVMVAVALALLFLLQRSSV